METVVAEKFEALVRLGRANSRMKDFRDLTTFARRCEFDGTLLSRAAKATFERRDTDLTDLDDILDPGFYGDSALNDRWRAYCRTIGHADTETLPEVGRELIRFLGPLAQALRGAPAPGAWSHAEGWASV